MNGKCFNCVSSASNRYTLVLGSEKVLEDKVICDECASEFSKEDWIEVYEAGSFDEVDDEEV